MARTKTDDMIYRHVAIDALQKEIDKWTPPFDHVIGAVRCGVRLARNIIGDLPSAQPDLQSTCNQLATDTISRAAAIEHLKKRLYETEFNSTAEYPYYQEIADNRVGVWMNEVPSAQPERKTGKWIQQDHNRRNGYVTTTVYYYPKCSECGNSGNYGMNYCPNCGARMEEQDE